MWIDLDRAGDFRFSRDYEVCVCGSGPAGITVARRLMKAGARVLLLEAGSTEWSEASQSIYAGESIGPLEYYAVDSSRLRYFGGTSNHWAGFCTRFNPIDFEERGIWEVPGWPIRIDDVYSYQDEARDILDITDQSFEKRSIPLWRDGRLVTSRWSSSPPTRFGEKYRSELEASPHLDVALNANVVDIKLNAEKHAVAEVIVANYNGKRFSVFPKYVVLAFGAMENARFLLSARSDITAGIGNHSDFVGRCFMEHFSLTLGRFVKTKPEFWTMEKDYGFNPSPDVMRERKIGNCFISLKPDTTPRFYGRLAPVRKAIRNVTCSSDVLLKLARRNTDVICAGDGTVGPIMEQSPNTSSRVLLDPARNDRFDQPAIRIDWRLNDLDRRTIRAVAEEVGKALAEQNIGRLRIAPQILDNGDPEVGMHAHHMGTTRMSLSPRDGVVNPDCRVHGIENLYIGGSSVFPTGGGCNPTFSIVCLSLRLGDHLAQRLGKTT